MPVTVAWKTLGVPPGSSYRHTRRAYKRIMQELDPKNKLVASRRDLLENEKLASKVTFAWDTLLYEKTWASEEQWTTPLPNDGIFPGPNATREECLNWCTRKVAAAANRNWKSLSRKDLNRLQQPRTKALRWYSWTLQKLYPRAVDLVHEAIKDDLRVGEPTTRLPGSGVAPESWVRCHRLLEDAGDDSVIVDVIGLVLYENWEHSN